MAHPFEAQESWVNYLERRQHTHDVSSHHHQQRRLSSSEPLLQHSSKAATTSMDLDLKAEREYAQTEKKHAKKTLMKKAKFIKKHEQRIQELYKNPGIKEKTTHGIMIDAGSTGTRLHIYEWEPRILRNEHDVELAVSGKRLSFPGTESRWTDRLHPGLSSFASVIDTDDLDNSIAEYFEPLMEFAYSVLHTKVGLFDQYPIFLRATGGMRILNREQRFRVMNATRSFFTRKCPFHFEDEYARVISGEEEASFGFVAVNLLLGNLVAESEGSGAVLNPRLTYGALDLGGASTQITFFEPSGDVMSNLFKLQIGQGKHWNLYAHSFLYYGVNEATNRLNAHLIEGHDATERLHVGIYNPCLPGGASMQIRSEINISADGMETWNATSEEEQGARHAVLKNDKVQGDFEECSKLAVALLNQEQNAWCDFAHRGDCSFAGVYQPELPTQLEHAGEFLAFSNYYRVWKFLDLPARSSIKELEEATRTACSMNAEDVREFAEDRVTKADIDQMCFRSTYALNMLKVGYGFKNTDYVTAQDVVQGQKVGWALGAMLYEINALPWKYAAGADAQEQTRAHTHHSSHHVGDHHRMVATTVFLAAVVVACIGALTATFVTRQKRLRALYEPIKSGDNVTAV